MQTISLRKTLEAISFERRRAIDEYRDEEDVTACTDNELGAIAVVNGS